MNPQRKRAYDQILSKALTLHNEKVILPCQSEELLSPLHRCSGPTWVAPIRDSIDDSRHRLSSWPAFQRLSKIGGADTIGISWDL